MKVQNTARTTLFHYPISASSLHKIKQLTSDFLPEPTSSNDSPPLIEYFEVTRPIKPPKTKPCSHHILHQNFGYTYAQPLVLANYTLPSNCPFHCFSKIMLVWKATYKGRQFDRIFDWIKLTLGFTMLMLPFTFTLLGVIMINQAQSFGALAFKGDVPTDLVLPISQNLLLNDGLWFEIKNSTNEGLKEFKVPQNSYRAILDGLVLVYQSIDEYLIANNLSGVPRGGSFREVMVSLDRKAVGAIWPFTVIYTKGVNPFLWRPITRISSFDLPSYDIEVTPFLGIILDKKSHSMGFNMTNAMNIWFIDTNLHLQFDGKSNKIKGRLVDLVDKPLVMSLVSDFEGMNRRSFLKNVQDGQATMVITGNLIVRGLGETQ
ncbi:Peptide-N4-(N-acetyl-beta-glucosaminyl)asparagine amidase A [Spatholobus suberectus]|nr:Peptide-N4-(N-acetyl-beta-glucosaminyl)asparagine amidase A [Spatholobus suberectus]